MGEGSGAADAEPRVPPGLHGSGGHGGVPGRHRLRAQLGGPSILGGLSGHVRDGDAAAAHPVYSLDLRRPHFTPPRLRHLRLLLQEGGPPPPLPGPSALPSCLQKGVLGHWPTLHRMRSRDCHALFTKAFTAESSHCVEACTALLSWLLCWTIPSHGLKACVFARSSLRLLRPFPHTA